MPVASGSEGEERSSVTGAWRAFGKVFATLAVVTLIFVVWYWGYYSSRHAELVRRHYHELANASRQASARLDGVIRHVQTYQVLDDGAHGRGPFSKESDGLQELTSNPLVELRERLPSCARRVDRYDDGVDLYITGDADNLWFHVGSESCCEDAKESPGATCGSSKAADVLRPLLDLELFDRVLLVEQPSEDREGRWRWRFPSARTSQSRPIVLLDRDRRGVAPVSLRTILAALDPAVAEQEETTSDGRQRENGAGTPLLEAITGENSSTPLTPLRLVEYEGGRSLLFVQPLERFGRFSNASDTETGSRWWVLGLASETTMAREAMRLSPQVVIALFFVLVLLAASWAILRLFEMGERERLSVADARLVVCSCLLGAGVLTGLVLAVFSSLRTHAAHDRELMRVYADISRKLKAELDAMNHDTVGVRKALFGNDSRASTTIEQLEECAAPCRESCTVAACFEGNPPPVGKSKKEREVECQEKVSKRYDECVHTEPWRPACANDRERGERECQQREREREAIEDLRKRRTTEKCQAKCAESCTHEIFRSHMEAWLHRWSPGYPSFSTLVLLGSDGRVRANWQVAFREPYGLNHAADAPVCHHSLWRLVRSAAISQPVSDRRYFRDVQSRTRLWTLMDGEAAIEPVQSRRTGENTVILAVGVGREQRYMLFVAGTLMSAIDPVLPPGVGFAIVSDSGELLLHSDAARNGQENILEECQHDVGLEAAVASGNADFLDGTCWGRSQRLYVKGLENGGWRLVVSRDQSDIQALTGLVTGSWLFLFGCYATFYVLGLVLLQLFAPRFRAEWLWPDERLRRSYWEAAGVVGVLTVAFVVLASRVPALTMSVVLLVLPGLVFAYLRVKLREPGMRPSWPLYLCWTGLVVVPLVTLLAWLGGPAWMRRDDFEKALSGNPSYDVAFFASALCLVSATLGSWWESRTRRSGSQTPTAAYASMFVALVVILGVAPSAYLFADAHGEVLDAFRRRLSRTASASCRARDVRLRQELARAGVPEAQVSNRLAKDIDLYPTRLSAAADGVGCGVFDVAAESACREGDDPATRRLCLELEKRMCSRVSVLGLHGFPRLKLWESVRQEGLVGNGRVRVDPRTRCVKSTGSGSRGKEGWIARLVWPPTGVVVAVAVLVGSLALLVLTMLIRAIVTRLFLLDASVPYVKESEPPSTLWGHVYERRPGGPGGVAVTLDVAKYSTPDAFRTAAKRLDMHEVRQVILYVSAVELAEAAWRPVILEVLERLIFGTGTGVAVLCDTEALAALAESSRDVTRDARPSSLELDRWGQLFAALPEHDTYIVMAARPDLPSTRWWLAWAASTPRERLALAQFARERFFNPGSRTIVNRLALRGLVVRDRALRFREPEFGDFILDVVQPNELARWEGAGVPSAWSRIRLPLTWFAVLVGAFFLVTQRELAASVVGLLTAGAGVIPFLLRITGIGGRSNARVGEG